MKYNILYNGRKIYQSLSQEECLEILQDFSEEYYEKDSDIDVNLIELEEIYGEETSTGKQDCN
jgi:hypothetical protein